MRARRRALGLATATMLLGTAGCGGGPAHLHSATLLLDFTPNAVHTGIYAAIARGDDRRAGVRLRVREPGASTDSVKLLAAGKVDLAVLDIHDLAIAREKGRDLVGVLALVQRPLAAVLAQPGIGTPRDLAGRTAGVSGLPSDDAVLASVVKGAGGNTARLRRITIGFNAIPALLSRRVSAATAFWDVEGVALRAKRPGMREFRVDDYGAPAYPELVVAVTRSTLEHRRGLVGDVTRALRNGYAFAIAHPASAADDLIAASHGVDRSLLAASQRALAPAFTLGGRARFGELDPRRLRAWAAWEKRFGIVRRAPDIKRAFAAP